MLTDYFYETTDGGNTHSSLNDAQARVDKDGLFRAVISAQDPGVPNWLDTAGNASGAVQRRWLDCSDKPIPDTRVVKVKDIRKYLHARTSSVTAEPREARSEEHTYQLTSPMRNSF